MPKSNKIILIIIGIAVLIPIIINEIHLRKKISLVNDVEEILNILADIKMPDATQEIIISDKYVIENKTYNVNGRGVIFLEENPSIMLSRDGMCALKLPYNDNVMFQEEECPNYRLVDGEKIVLQ